MLPFNSARARHSAAIVAALGTATTVAFVPVTFATPAGDNVIISEVYGGGGNSGASYTNDFIELYNPTDHAIDLSGWNVEYFSGVGNSGGKTSLTGSIPAHDYYLVQEAKGTAGTTALPTPNATGTLNMSGTAGSVKLNSSTGTVDTIGYGSAIIFEGAPSKGTSNSTSASRNDQGADTDNNAADFTIGAPTPKAAGASTGTTTPTEPPAATTVSIADIQGTGDASPMVDKTVTTTGVVTAVYNEGGFNGYTIQTGGSGKTTKNPGDASDGLFVYVGSGTTYPKVGDSVQVTGTVAEFNGLTELKQTGMAPSASPLEAVTPVNLAALPEGDAAREPYESMLLLPGQHTVTDNYSLNTFGTLGLFPGDKPAYQPTDRVLPGDEAKAMQAANDAKKVVLDDGRTKNYMSSDKTTPLPYIATDGAKNIKPVRTGDQVFFAHPVVLTYDHSAWTFEPTAPVTGNTNAADLPISWNDSRAAERDAMSTVPGDYSMASFNVLNFFTDLGKDEAGCQSYNDMNNNPVTAKDCTVRGAYTDAAFQDQQAKIVNAISTLNVDILGLEEIENTATVSGDPARRDESLSKLVAALNAKTGTERWKYVNSPVKVGDSEDYIRVAFIYNPAKVSPVGESRIFNDDAFTGKARQPLAQEFTPADGKDEQSIVAVVNHFKSKGSVADGDADTGDGQGNNAHVRNAEAQALLSHLGEQTDWADKPVFLLGDLNSYSREDSVRTLEANGFTNLGGQFANSEPTYQFGGQLGSLDHALANGAADKLVAGARVWNINSDESVAFEYSRRHYNAVDFYDDSPFRSSDHDPIKVGFNFPEAPAAPTTTETTSATSTETTKPSESTQSPQPQTLTPAATAPAHPGKGKEHAPGQQKCTPEQATEQNKHHGFGRALDVLARVFGNKKHC